MLFLFKKIQSWTQRDLVRSLFGGKIKYKLKCRNCPRSSDIEESFFGLRLLSLPIEETYSVSLTLGRCIGKEEVIKNYFCKGCDKRVSCVKTQSQGKILILRLNLLTSNEDKLKGKVRNESKLDTYFDLGSDEVSW